jgi:hypothetical protein
VPTAAAPLAVPSPTVVGDAAAWLAAKEGGAPAADVVSVRVFAGYDSSAAIVAARRVDAVSPETGPASESE